jgi:hypothetical protein
LRGFYCVDAARARPMAAARVPESSNGNFSAGGKLLI